MFTTTLYYWLDGDYFANVINRKMEGLLKWFTKMITNEVMLATRSNYYYAPSYPDEDSDIMMISSPYRRYTVHPNFY
jgi:hypothetical protein